MRKWHPKFKFYFFGFGIPLLLVLFWAGRDVVLLGCNFWEIRKLEKSVDKLRKERDEMASELARLEKNDSLAWEKRLRQSRALKPNEVEYRFK